MAEWVLKYWLEILFVALLGYVTKVWRSQKALKTAMQALLRDRLIQAYNYHMDKGYCYIYERDTVNNMYQQYHILGANGVIDDLMEEFCELPTRRKASRNNLIRESNKESVGSEY